MRENPTRESLFRSRRIVITFQKKIYYLLINLCLFVFFFSQACYEEIETEFSFNRNKLIIIVMHVENYFLIFIFLNSNSL